jgi:hypothetical protein
VTERELSRNAARLLAIIHHAQEVTGNVALTCRYYDISREAFYNWRGAATKSWAPMASGTVPADLS